MERAQLAQRPRVEVLRGLRPSDLEGLGPSASRRAVNAD